MTDHLLSNANIFMTGGAGTLGQAIATRRQKEGWTGKLTVYSSDAHKHDLMRRYFPDVNFIQGDIRNPETLYNGMVGHDIVLHLAAVKVIPASEWASIDTVDVNVNGSLNVCQQSISAGIKHVLGISTDKAAYPVNAYGASKMLMEKIFQEYSRIESDTQFHLCRYGNVLESTGSVIEAWKNAVARGEAIQITDPNMTRFWLSPQQAVDIVLSALEEDSGRIYVPRMKSLSIAKLARYTVFDGEPIFTAKSIPLRPGEKFHECLVTAEEAKRSFPYPSAWIIPPTTEANPYHLHSNEAFTSDQAEEMTQDELLRLLRNE